MLSRILNRVRNSPGRQEAGDASSAVGASTDAADSVGFSGNYASWDAALADSPGYAASIILEKTRASALKVKNGEARFERDSVVFDRPEYSFPVLAALLRAGVEDGRLSVLDFGGSLGSTYFQCREFLGGLPQVRWSVVEQPAHVACGQTEFQDEVLKFYYSATDCLEHERPNVLLLSSVLAYLKDPYEMLQGLIAKGIPRIILDRLGIIGGGADRLTLETVPASIYPATYPAWFFSEEKILSCFASSYSLVTDFVGAESQWYKLDGADIAFKGYIFEAKSKPAAPARHARNATAGQRPLLVNVGCGMRIHPDWVNIDLHAARPGVIEHDISVSLPQETNTCDAVYHSAVLEHIRPRDVDRFISECFRVLKPGGVMRVCVPDLENIAELYLRKLRDAVEGVPGAEADYDWMLLEMFDQTVRERSGGEMLAFLARNPMPNEGFVFERIGIEGEEIVAQIRQNPEGVAAAINAPPPDELAIGKFRLSGEVHQWMYDRFSLGRLLKKAGFTDYRVVSPTESRIPNWIDFHLDMRPDGRIVKPDLFFAEAVKPGEMPTP